jgi:hypothetical protein
MMQHHNSVVVINDVAFPNAEVDTAEVQQQVKTALYVGIAGVVLGTLGLLIGLMGLRARKTS